MEAIKGILFPEFSCHQVDAVRAFQRGKSPAIFMPVKKAVFLSPSSIKGRFKRVFSFSDEDVAGIPLICFSPEGLNRHFNTGA